MANADVAAWEEQLIAEMRAHGGRPTDGPLEGPSTDAPVLDGRQEQSEAPIDRDVLP